MTMTEATGSGTGRAQGTTHGSAVAGSAVDSGLVTSRVPYTVPQPPATIDAAIWPSIATVPSSLKARVAGRAADAIFKAAVRRLPLEVRYPDGTVLGKAALGKAALGNAVVGEAPSDPAPAGTRTARY